MPKFKFELEEILKVRQFEQSRAESELAVSIAQENKINDDLKTIAMQYASSKAQINTKSNFDDVLAQNQYKKLLDYQKECLLQDLANQKIISEEKRKVVLECMKKTNALEKMKDIQKQEFKVQEKLKEKKRLEDLASLKVHEEK